MPIYEYECEACGHQFDEIQKVQDPALTECPECGKSTLRKLISAPSFQLKGEGWYNTDYKKDKKKETKSESSSSKKETKTESGSESKSAAATGAVKSSDTK